MCALCRARSAAGLDRRALRATVWIGGVLWFGDASRQHRIAGSNSHVVRMTEPYGATSFRIARVHAAAVAGNDPPSWSVAHGR
ncbi:hypothetical protein DZD52_01460 [Xanthomonas nasturtii]|uniref:Uncharacterized protein n=1 Tax=Xanthomonas nasturtii TaxID=1843581 RepID=A0A3E1KSY2_9XANT|nr:hypothetical protein DZD52_01460 [Xanthomonas nasturtii]